VRAPVYLMPARRHACCTSIAWPSLGRPAPEQIGKLALLARYMLNSPDLAARCILNLQARGKLPEGTIDRYHACCASLQAPNRSYLCHPRACPEDPPCRERRS